MAVEEKRMRQIRDTSSAWTNENPTLLDGELGIETDTGSIKVGDGATAWNALPYIVRPALLDNLTASSPPTTIDDSTRGYAPGSRWWVNRSTWWICTDATPSAAVWVTAEAQLPLLQAYDLNFAFGRSTAFASGTALGPVLTTPRSWVLPQNMAEAAGSLSHGGHTQRVAFDLFAFRVEWGADPVKLCRVEFAATAQKATFDEFHADLVAGPVTFADDSIVYLVDTYGEIAQNMIADQNGDVTLAATVAV